MREQGRARGPGFSRAASSRRAARRRCSRPRRCGRRCGGSPATRRGSAEPAPPGGTTHVSVIDGEGNAAALSTSTGSGSGVIVPGTGIYLNNMLGEYDLVGGRPPRPGVRLTSMMAPTIARRVPTAARGSSSAAPARRGCAARSCRSSSTCSSTASASRRRSTRPAIHVDGDARPLRGRPRPGRARPARRARLRGRPLAPPEPLLRRRRRRRARHRRLARGRRRPAPRRRRGARRMNVTRPAGRSRRRARARRARERRRERGGGLALADSRWRSAGDERRYIRALQRHPDAALFVAELETGELVGRLSVMRDPHPACRHVADLGLMVAAPLPPPRHRHRPDGRAPSSGRARRASGSSSCTSSRTTRRRSRSTRSSATSGRGCASGHYARADGRLRDVILMAKRL